MVHRSSITTRIFHDLQRCDLTSDTTIKHGDVREGWDNKKQRLIPDPDYTLPLLRPPHSTKEEEEQKNSGRVTDWNTRRPHPFCARLLPSSLSPPRPLEGRGEGGGSNQIWSCWCEARRQKRSLRAGQSSKESAMKKELNLSECRHVYSKSPDS